MSELSIRYLSLPSFLLLAARRSILLRRIDLFEDPQESCPNWSCADGALHAARIGRMVWVSSWCEYRGNESIAMWDLYSGREGIAVVAESAFLVSSLESVVAPSGHEIVKRGFDFVRYAEQREEGDFLAKRVCFRHEEEKRLWIQFRQIGHECEASRPEPSASAEMPFDLSNAREVIVGPRAPTWFRTTLNDLIDRMAPGTTIRQSNLLAR